MSEAQTLLLGCIAGATIVLGLPMGRLRTPRPGLSQFLNATAIGVLLFLIWDVLVHAYEPVAAALGRLHDGTAGIGPVLGYGALFLLGIGVGLLSLVCYERWLGRRARPKRFGPGAMARGEVTGRTSGIAGWSAARRLSLLIAVGIGLHNFGEGLAIGASAAAGAIGLATILVLAADGDRPSWSFLLMMGLIGGGPTAVGTAVGRQFTSAPVSVIFLTLAAGSILYVVIQLFGVALKGKRKDYLYWGVLLGLAAGFVTDMIVTAGGG